jgi:hypothetical protein
MAAVVIDPPRFGARSRNQNCAWLRMRGSHETSRERRPAEAHRAIKVPLDYHQDRRPLRILKGCPANQGAFGQNLLQQAIEPKITDGI